MLPALLAGAAIVLGGCTSAEEEFRDELKPVRAELESRKTQIATQLQSVKLGRARDSRELAAAAGGLATTVNRMSTMDPPGSVQDEFRAFLDANGRLVASLQAFAEALRGRNADRLRQRGEESQAAAGNVRAAESDLDKALAG